MFPTTETKPTICDIAEKIKTRISGAYAASPDAQRRKVSQVLSGVVISRGAVNSVNILNEVRPSENCVLTQQSGDLERITLTSLSRADALVTNPEREIENKIYAAIISAGVPEVRPPAQTSGATGHYAGSENPPKYL
jgi:hypothetical protein